MGEKEYEDYLGLIDDYDDVREDERECSEDYDDDYDDDEDY